MHLTPLALSIVGALSLSASASSESGSVKLINLEQFRDWLANTDANVTFVGKPMGDLSDASKFNALDTVVTYCSTRADNVCGGTCHVYIGGATCIHAPGTNCLTATTNVAFCDRSGCGHSCNQFSTCGTHLDDNFCYTPGTKSILVPA